jgi:hypothetical protein
MTVGARTHMILGLVAILLLPAGSWWRGPGSFAFTMFSRSGSYRLRIVVTDPSGKAQRIPPTALAAQLGGSVGNLLAGSESWRYAPFGALLRRRIDEVATLACTLPGAATARVELDERETLDAPPRTSRALTRCR